MNLRELLQHHNVPTAPEGHHHVSRGWIGIDCPQCSPNSGRFRLGLNSRSGAVHCWQCGTLGILSILSSVTGLSRNEVRSYWNRQSVFLTPSDTIKRGSLRIPYAVESLRPAHEHYLTERGFSIAELVSTWKIQGIGPVSELGLEWRIFIPIHLDGLMVSWTTRSLIDKGVRYVNAPSEWESVPRRELLYGEDFVGHTVIVTEGPTDVWRIGPGAVCTFGVAFSRAQVERLSKFPHRIICFDNEEGAQIKARELCQQLQPFPGETTNVVLDSKDPGSAKDREIQQLRRFLR